MIHSACGFGSGPPTRLLSRRDLLARLAMGAGSAVVGPGLLQLVTRQAFAQATGGAAIGKKHKRLVVLWMEGGPSQLDTFDPKPGASTNGPFKALPTGVEGWQMSEFLPQLAARAEHLAIVRTLTSKESSHARARELLHFGYPPSPAVDYPSLGAIVTHEIGDLDHDLPAFVQIGGIPFTAGHLGVECAPFVVKNPSSKVENLAYRRGSDPKQMDLREQMRSLIDDDFEQRGGTGVVDAFESKRRRARRLMDSPLRVAFDLSREPTAAAAAYGATPFGKGMLLARRLLEHGVTAIEVSLDGWDTHLDNFNRTKALCEVLDPAFSALVDDLRTRNLLEETLIVCMGEFGRTPVINAQEGRDHWPSNSFVVLAGGGSKPGTVVGETDERGIAIVRRPVQVADLFATIAQLLGFERDKEFNPTGRRPVKLVDPDGIVVPELVA